MAAPAPIVTPTDSSVSTSVPQTATYLLGDARDRAFSLFSAISYAAQTGTLPPTTDTSYIQSSASATTPLTYTIYDPSATVLGAIYVAPTYTPAMAPTSIPSITSAPIPVTSATSTSSPAPVPTPLPSTPLPVLLDSKKTTIPDDPGMSDMALAGMTIGGIVIFVAISYGIYHYMK